MSKQTLIDKICYRAYNILVSTQDESGEFGKNCLDIIHNENNLRHPNTFNNTLNNIVLQNKPNCSVTLISALGISYFKGIEDESVIKALHWFTESDYISKGWFRQKIHVVDANPFGPSIPQISQVTDIRHTATALLAALYFNGPVTFISDALRNLLADDCRDFEHKGWRSDKGIEHAPTDFYTTVYMLASLYYLEVSGTYKNFSLSLTQIKQLITNGLNAVCCRPPQQLGYNSSIEQTLRTNGTLLFFLAPILSNIYPEYLEDSVSFILQHAHRQNGEVSWLNNDFDATVNILSGLMIANKYLDQTVIKLNKIIESAKCFIENNFMSLSSFHPVSLGFILFIYKQSASLNIKKEDMSMDILLMVSTKDEEDAITEFEVFQERELDNGITYLFQETHGLKVALARGFEYGEIDATIMAQTLYIKLKPKVLAMAGFCAGKRGCQTLGDVVIAEKVFNYDYGKQVSRNKVEPQISNYKLDVRIKQRIERYDERWRTTLKLDPPKDFELQCYEFLKELSYHKNGVKPIDLYDKTKYPNWESLVSHFLSEEYIKRIHNNEQILLSTKGQRKLNDLLLLFPEGYNPCQPSTKLGVLATGTKVQQWDNIFNYLNNQFDRKCTVLDMEGHAMGKLSEFNKCPFIIAKGVGDFAQNGKQFDNRFIKYAVYSSYKFLIEFFKDNFTKLFS